MDWVFVTQVEDGIDRMAQLGEEIMEANSYFPYQIDMGLPVKLAYSAFANPYFFEFVLVIGSLLKSQRSLMAPHTSEG